VVVGGGPTGCEFAGELHDFLIHDIKRYYPHLLPFVSISLIQSQDKILNTFDKNISLYAVEKFKRDKIDVYLNSRVKAVEKNKLMIFDKNKNMDVTMPFGLCIWSTGIDPVPLVKDLCAQLQPKGQTNKKALVVDDHLVVKGTKNIFAIGDCSTMERKLLKVHLEQLFIEFDKDKNGQISYDEFVEFIAGVSKIYPQIAVYNRKLLKTFKEFDLDSSDSLSFTEFQELLAHADNELTILPTTAQVASQEGLYLGKLFSQLKVHTIEDIPSFNYNHRGSFASLGGHNAVGEVPGLVTGGGIDVWLMWRGVYLAKQFSLYNKVRMLTDWIRTSLFGRDISRF